MELSVVILNYKTRGLLKQCLKGLLGQTLPFTAEVIVVDNRSNDGTASMLRDEFPSVRCIENEKNIGFAGGMNVGLRASTGRYVLVLNPDVAVLGNAIAAMHRFLEQHPDVGMCAPKLLNPDGTVQTSCRRFPSPSVIVFRRSPFGALPFAKAPLRRFLMLDWDHASNRPVDWALGACLMVRRSAMEKVGLFDERFFLYFEDVDWCRRFWEHGFPVYYVGAEAELVHFHQRQSAASAGMAGLFSYPTRRHIESGLKYFMKYAGARLPSTMHNNNHGT